jgi:Heterokaryon incompatibility protein (HET)
VPILLNGHVFNLTTNLEFALRHLRLEEREWTFWIDAICINQLHVKERNQQVRSMGEFYKAAQQTTIWLGLEAEHTALAFQYILEREHVAQTQSLKQAVVGCQYHKSLFLEEPNELVRFAAPIPLL